MAGAGLEVEVPLREVEGWQGLVPLRAGREGSRAVVCLGGDAASATYAVIVVEPVRGEVR